MEKILKKHLPDGRFKDVSPERSRAMSAVRSSGNKTTEHRLRFALVRAGIKGWKLRPRKVPGNPDFFFPEKKLVVFVDGCFWHGCSMCGHIPNKNRNFWRAKIERNRERDQTINMRLKEAGLLVLRFWEHELKDDLEGCVARINATMACNRVLDIH